MEYSNDMSDVYKNIEDYNPDNKRKLLIVIDDMIADMINNKKLNPTVTELFIIGSKLKTTQSYFRVPKDVILSSTTFLLLKFQIKENFSKLL